MHEVDTPMWCTYVAHINEFGVWHNEFHLTNICDENILSTKKHTEVMHEIQHIINHMYE